MYFLGTVTPQKEHHLVSFIWKSRQLTPKRSRILVLQVRRKIRMFDFNVNCPFNQTENAILTMHMWSCSFFFLFDILKFTQALSRQRQYQTVTMCFKVVRDTSSWLRSAPNFNEYFFGQCYTIPPSLMKIGLVVLPQSGWQTNKPTKLWQRF